MKRWFLVSMLLAASAAPLAFPASAPARRLLNNDDVDRVQDVSETQVSPDGQWVAYLVTTTDREADESRNAIWMASWDGHQQVRLTNPDSGVGKPRWSPDGRYLAYVAELPGSDSGQIMLLDRRGGEARQISKIGGDINEIQWAPDSKRLVVAMDPADDDKAPKPFVIDAWHFKQDGAGYLRAGHAVHLYVLDMDSGKLDALTSDPRFADDLPAWSPDGRQIAFVRSTEHGVDPDGRADIDVMEARPGATPHTVARPLAPNSQRLAWSSDGALVVFLQGIEPKFNAYIQDRLAVVPAAGGTPRSLTDKLDRAVMSYAITTATTAIVAVEDDGVIYPASVDLTSGALSRLGPPRKSVVSAISSAGGHTAMLESDDHAFAEVHALEGTLLRKLTSHNDALLSEVTLASVEDTQFKNKSGVEIHGLVVKPPDFQPGRKYPLVLWIHGGPNGQDEHSLSLDGYLFEPQIFAAKGYVVLRVNYRGGSGRGLEFARTIYADWGHKEVEDLLAGVDHLVATGVADPARLAIGGWSYGGILTDYTIASDRRFKVAISGAGSANQLSTYGSDQYILQYSHELGAPWTNTALWLKVSYPFYHADRIHTPTLFIGGDKDFNVPVIGSEQMYQALRSLGVPAQLAIYPGEHHVFTRPSFVRDLEIRESAWLDRFISVTAPAP